MAQRTMTLHNLNRPLCLRCLKSIFLNSRVCRMFSSKEKDISVYEEDVFDNFTSKLVQQKSDKWEAQKQLTLKNIKIKTPIKSRTYPCGTCIEFLSIGKINILLQNAVDIEDNNLVLDLSRQCIKFQKCPSLSILINVLSICSQNGEKDMVVELTKLCEQLRPDILENNSYFQHYLAEAIWIKGNITKSLKIFGEVYEENVYVRRRIRLMLRYLIHHSMVNRSEAALLNIIEFSENLLSTYKDYFPLACIWQACFLSEWFSDQCIALQLLEKNEAFCKMIMNRIAYVVNVSLRNHRTEIVYRLLEVLLKHKLKPQYTVVVWALLDYQIRQGDLRGCLEIVKWSLKNDIDIPSIHQEKFLQLLIENNVSLPGSKVERSKPPPETNFKF